MLFGANGFSKLLNFFIGLLIISEKISEIQTSVDYFDRLKYDKTLPVESFPLRRIMLIFPPLSRLSYT